MTLDVIFSPQEIPAGSLAGRTVLVIDALRATTTMCAALAHGARAVVPTLEVADALRLAEVLGPVDVVLAGERECVRIDGFQLGNSPSEMTSDIVQGKTVIMSTTNGTGALLAAAAAREVVVASLANLDVVGAHARCVLDAQGDLVILCAGREGGFGLDDAYVAGRLAVRALGGSRRRKGLNDGALVAVDLVSRYRDRAERVLAMSRAGRELMRRGFGEDVRAASVHNAWPVLPFFHERRVTLHPPAAG